MSDDDRVGEKEGYSLGDGCSSSREQTPVTRPDPSGHAFVGERLMPDLILGRSRLALNRVTNNGATRDPLLSGLIFQGDHPPFDAV